MSARADGLVSTSTSVALPRRCSEDVAIGYIEAHGRIIEAGFASDLEWVESLGRVSPNLDYVFGEYAWVVVNSGFRYSVARKLFPALSEAFGWFRKDSLERIAAFTDAERNRALAVLNHERKIDAIIAMASILIDEGIEQIVADAADPPKLTRLPYIGKITCWHFAKVLGADVVKPDVHLQRAAVAAGYETPLDLARALGQRFGDRLTVVDSILWRYGEQRARHGWPTFDALFRSRSRTTGIGR